MTTEELTNEAINNFNKIVADGEPYVRLIQIEKDNELITYTFEIKKLIIN